MGHPPVLLAPGSRARARGLHPNSKRERGYAPARTRSLTIFVEPPGGIVTP